MRLLYRLLLAAYPASLRHEYGDEMTAAMTAAWQTARKAGWPARMRMIGRLLIDWIVSLPAAWRGRPTRINQPQKRDAMFTTMIRELRLAVRVLWNNRWSTAATILTLSLAIGATTAVYSVVHAVILRPLPYAAPDQLVSIWEHNLVRDQTHNPISPANFHQWRDRAQSFAALAAFVDSTVPVTGDGTPEELTMKYMSWNLLDILNVRPALGRNLRESDSAADAPRKALLSWRLWQRRYNGDPAIVGRSLTLAGAQVEVIGVLPADFRLRGENADIWCQIRYSAAQRQPSGRGWYAIGRLKPGVTVAQARAEMNGLMELLQQQWPSFDTGWRTTVVSMQEGMTGDVRTPLLLMLMAVAVVLIAGSANTVNLLLARASARQREMAVRSAMGATRWHIVRQLSAEGVVLAATGVAGGLLIAAGTLKVLAQFGDRLGIARITDAALDSSVLLVALGIMAACAAVFSLVPAWHAGRPNLTAPLASGGRWSTGHRRDRRTRELLVIGQVSCAVVLVISGGVITQSLMRLVSVNPGFDQRVYTFSVSLPGTKYGAEGASMRFFDQAMARLRSTPGIEMASYMTFLPFNGLGTATNFVRTDQPPPPAGQEPVADIRPIDDGFFGVMRIPVLSGRGFTADEVRQGQKVCVISAATAREVFGDESPLGKWLNINLNGGGPDLIVGVVGDIRHSNLRTVPRPMIYYPFGRFPLNFMSAVVRGGLDDRSMKAAAESIIKELDSSIPVTDAQRMQDLVNVSVASPTAAAELVSGFGLLALVLCVVGVGSLLAAVVANRTGEFGVRLALGATPRQIRGLVLRQGALLIGIGLTIGVAMSFFASRALARVLFDVRPVEPAIYLTALAVIALLGLVAADIPARRATHVNPVETLR